ncbi:MAG TPA: hypothetical protein VFU27_01375 [Terriglobales bacterium]|nr:hypothetical protein [Terriglobales bacterium]
MKAGSTFRCEVCGAPQAGHGWFLVAEDRESDTLQILKWNPRLAEHPNVRHLCSAAHVQQFVSQWMLAGGVDGSWPELSPGSEPHHLGNEADASYRLGELALDRASFAALGERPDMLSSILEAIEGALGPSGSSSALEGAEEEEEDAAPVYDA